MYSSSSAISFSAYGGITSKNGVHANTLTLAFEAFRLQEVQLRPLNQLRRAGEVEPAIERVVKDFDVVDDKGWRLNAFRAQPPDFILERRFAVAGKLVRRGPSGKPISMLCLRPRTSAATRITNMIKKKFVIKSKPCFEKGKGLRI